MPSSLCFCLFNLGGRRSHQNVTVDPLSARQQRPFTGRYCGSPSGQKNSAEFEHQLFPDMQNSFLESRAGRVKKHGELRKVWKGTRQTVLKF